MNLANKLSSHVLGMKFMRRTKNQVDKERVEKKHREHFAPPAVIEVEDIKPDTKNLLKTTGHVEEIPSYSQCEKWIFGRQSFGGFNPEVESNVLKGVWRNHYVGEPVGNNEEEEPIKREPDNEVDVPDEEMAATYGSIIGTLAKHFKKKKDRNDNPNNQGAKSGNRKEKEKFHQKQKFNRQDAQAQGNSKNQQHNGNKNRGHKRPHDSDNNKQDYQQKKPNKKYFGKQQQQKSSEYGTPPKKKRFMKPSDK